MKLLNRPPFDATSNGHVDDEITVSMELITPAIAASQLERNDNYRNLDMNLAKRYADVMTRGQWNSQNGEAIKVTAEGWLLDGQHRLQAIVLSGLPQTLLVIRGVKPTAVVTMDQGRPRNLRNHLSAAGETNASNLAAALNAYWIYFKTGVMHGGTGGPHVRGTLIDLLNLLDENPGIRESVRAAQAVRNNVRIPVSSVAALHYHLVQRAPEDTEAFYEKFATGAGLDGGNPILLLRSTIEKDASATRRMSHMHKMALIIKAWNMWVTGDHKSRLVWTPGGARAEDFPTPIIADGE